jgi:hypothetical protein
MRGEKERGKEEERREGEEREGKRRGRRIEGKGETRGKEKQLLSKTVLEKPSKKLQPFIAIKKK